MSAATSAVLPMLPAVGAGAAGAGRPDGAVAGDGAGFASWLEAEAPDAIGAEVVDDDVARATPPGEATAMAEAAVAPPAAAPAPPPLATSGLMGAMLQALSVREDGSALLDTDDATPSPGARGPNGAAPAASTPLASWSIDTRGLQVAQPPAVPLPQDASIVGQPTAPAANLAPAQNLFASGLAASVLAAESAMPPTRAPGPATPSAEGAEAALPIPPMPYALSPSPPPPRATPVAATTQASAPGAPAPSALSPLPPEGLVPMVGESTAAAPGAAQPGLESTLASSPASPAVATPISGNPAAAGLLPTHVVQATRADGALPPVQAPLDSPQWGNEFASRVVAMVREDFAEAEIRVTPQELGPIEVRIRIEGDRLHAQFGAVSAEAREALMSNLHRLREMLAGEGLNLGQAFVGHHGGGHAGERGPGTPHAASLAQDRNDGLPEAAPTPRTSRGDRDALLDEFA